MDLALAVLGAGMILSPPVTAGLAGGQGLLAFLEHLAVGGTFSLAVGMLGRRRGQVSGLADLAGTRVSRLVTGLYLAGFISGQAAIALTSGWLIGFGLQTGSELVAVIFGIGVVAVVVLANLAGLRLPGRARNWRVLITFLFAVALCSDHNLLRVSEMLPAVHGRELWAAAFLLLFAGVGWERSAVLASSAGSGRSLAAAVVFGWTLAGSGYLVLWGIVATAGRTGSVPWPAGWSRVLALLTAVLLASFCMTNVDAAGGFLARLVSTLRWPGPARRPATVIAVGAAVCLVLACALAGNWHAYQLLAGPAAAALLIYLTVLGCGVERNWRVIAFLALPAGLLLFTAAAALGSGTWLPR